jgi:hypothetical protein
MLPARPCLGCGEPDVGPLNENAHLAHIRWLIEVHLAESLEMDPSPDEHDVAYAQRLLTHVRRLLTSIYVVAQEAGPGPGLSESSL